MSRYVAFLRGINLGKRRPPMSQLKALFEEIGFKDVATFIASGNVVFTSSAKDRRKLEQKISSHLHGALGYEVDSFVRTFEEVRAVSTSQPFQSADGATLHVCWLHEPLSDLTARKLESVKTATDEFRVAGGHFFWLCRLKINESTIWKELALRQVPLPSFTMRNITSVRKLVAKHLMD